MSFHVGQRVVCIGYALAPGQGYGTEILPVRGLVYTVRGIDLNRPYCRCRVGLRLEEIINVPRLYRGYGLDEASFGADHFRPIIERKTSIDIFTAMLKPSPTKREPVAALNAVLARSVARMTAKLRFKGERA